MSEPEILFPGGYFRTEKFENTEIDASFIDSACPSEGLDKALSAFNASFPAGFFDCLFQEEVVHAQ
jgi:hypothetical protein